MNNAVGSVRIFNVNTQCSHFPVVLQIKWIVVNWHLRFIASSQSTSQLDLWWKRIRGLEEYTSTFLCSAPRGSGPTQHVLTSAAKPQPPGRDVSAQGSPFEADNTGVLCLATSRIPGYQQMRTINLTIWTECLGTAKRNYQLGKVPEAKPGVSQEPALKALS